MSKKIRFSLLAALVVFVAGSAAAAFLQAQAVKPCCIAGKYRGFQVNHANPNCPLPEKDYFTMTIKQDKSCSASLEGTIVDSSGTVNNWTGTVSPGLRRCCTLEGSFLTPSGNTAKFKGTICRNKFGKWIAKGTWVEIGSTDPCNDSGTWQMAQA